MDEFRLPGYEIDELLGFGGSGEVWRAIERSSGDVVALKRLHGGDEAGASVASDRLRREAALLASVTHGHLVRLRSVVPTGRGLVLVLDYAAGGSLAAVLAARGKVSAGEVVTLGAPLAQALAAVHAQGVVHGDVTPGNVLFDGTGKPLLADLGVARLAGEQGATVGVTVGYADPALELVPEGATGVRLGPASDVHGLAAVCFHALAGVAPYAAGVRFAEPLGPLAPGAPAALVSAIEAALDPDPFERPDAAAFARMLFASCSPVAVLLPKPSGPVVAATTHEVPLARRRPAVVPPAPDANAGPGRHRVTPGLVWLRRGSIAVIAVVLLGGAVAAGIGWAGWVGQDRSAAAASSVPTAGPTSVPAAGSTSVPAAGPTSVPGVSAPIDDVAGDAAPAAAGEWSAVVNDLDTVRDGAFADGDPDELAAVYVPGTSALATDRASLNQLMAAGERARGLTFRLVSVGIVSRTSTQITLAVSDILPSYQLVKSSGTGGTAVNGVTVAGRGERRWSVVLQVDTDDAIWRILSVAAAP